MILNSLLIFLMSVCNLPAGKNYALKPFTGINQAPFFSTSEQWDIINSSADSILNEYHSGKRSKAAELTDFAETLKGISYRFGAADPKHGFDCSGFINYVYKQFDITVPRASREFTNFAKEIKLSEAKRGDLILFTGTDSTKRVVGHMGIITSNNGQSHEFIHSTSGKAYGVTITPLNRYYQGRFVKVIRVLNEDKI
ncbi:C40 family peptidase [Daejeonella sp. H1SJ63]|uniref:C40 family peptidase n=1 Tax=Daejeonella sp. H1SJ63 TaxID=3034145 RepID=UPI0023ED1C9E|nr:C40 family peptidase [Daejeonella sp. H1SJ63]